MLGVSVQGGTGAGSRIVKQRERWVCECGRDVRPTASAYSALIRVQTGERYSCPDCGTRRPA